MKRKRYLKSKTSISFSSLIPHPSFLIPHSSSFPLVAVFLLILILLAGATSACKRGGEPGTLVIALELAPRGFDPRFSGGSAYSARIMQLIYDTLLVKDEKFDLVPSLAESFEESEDFKTFTFRLRRDAVFHNGEPLTARDVKFTFESIG